MSVEMSGEPKPLPPMVIEMTQIEGIFLKKKVDLRKDFDWPRIIWQRIKKRRTKKHKSSVDCPAC